MTQLHEVFSLLEFSEMVRDGVVRTQDHPSLPLTIAVYSEKAVIDRTWNATTRACRGLIWNNLTGEVLARPFPKFFNIGESLAREDYEAPVEVTDKMDGSLGIGYVWEGKCYIATKGSFDSEQAREANKILHKYYPGWLPPLGVTPLWEIIYPENRIVLDYGDLRFLSLIDGIEIATGKTYNPDGMEDHGLHSSWIGAHVRLTMYNTLYEAVNAVPRQNAEGFVVRYLDDDTRVKIKQKDYLEKHKMVFHLSQKSVWKSLRDGEYDNYKAGMPDEFHDWMDKAAEPYVKNFLDYDSVIQDTWYSDDLVYLNREIRRGDRFCREILADMLRNTPRWLEKSIWCLIDGQDYTRYIYDLFEPKGQTKVAKP
jgi:RNA ligase